MVFVDRVPKAMPNGLHNHGAPLAECPWLEHLRCPFASAQCHHPDSETCVLVAARQVLTVEEPAGAKAQSSVSGGDPSPRWRSLSPRESEVAQLAERGLRTKAIAAELNISPNTARNHLKAIFRKLNVRSQVELMAARHD